MLNSEKAREIINKQQPVSQDIINRVKNNLAQKGVILSQSAELDEYLISQGKEAITFSDGQTIIMHTKASASGFYEEMIHLGQIKKGRAVENDKKNNILLEIEAKERLIKYQKAYKITDYEISNINEALNHYKVLLNNLRNGGV